MKTLLDIGLSVNERNFILRGVHEGKYNLLLGAGASYGCFGGDGAELKDGATLSRQINDSFDLGLNTTEADKLPLTYEDALISQPANFRNWLRKRFTGCQPLWQSQIFRIHWERIWTFNIDDVLENSFDAGRDSNLVNEILPFDWLDKVTPLDSTPTAIQAIYLHGRASQLGNASKNLIFSIPEYAVATRRFPGWHASFQTTYLEKPFIVCGASLTEEVDLAEAIRSKNQSSANGFPSIFVSFSLDEGQKKRIRRYNLIPLVCPLDEFFSILANEMIEFRKTADAVSARLKAGTYERFMAEFRRLEGANVSSLVVKGTDFYGGDEPTWLDILNERDFMFGATSRAAKALENSANRYAVLLHGESVSGKTTGLLRIARIALQLGYKPFWFRHEEGLNVEVVGDYLAEDDRAILFVDDAANYLGAIGTILEIAKRKGKPARFFLSLRSARLRGFRIDMADEFQNEFKIGPMSQGDIVNFVQKRRQASRLGKHINDPDSKIIKEIKIECKSELLDSISHIEFSEPLRVRVRKLVLAEIGSDEKKRLLSRIVCVHRFGYSLPLRAAVASCGLPFDAFSSLMDGTLKTEGIFVRDSRGLRLRHRILSEYTWTEAFNDDERYEAMSAVTSALAPLVNPTVIKMKGIEHLILREVLDQEQVANSIRGRALQFYEEHEDLLGWSSRYWDQRALLEYRQEGNFPKAYSYSQKAISLEKHAFAYTSLGTICMRHCVQLVEKNHTEAMRFFYEGEDALTQAFELNSRGDKLHEHPFTTFFASATQMFRKLSPLEPEFESVLELYKIWIQRADDSPAFATFFQKKRLRGIKATQLKEQLRMQRYRAGKN